jgi:outer membrane protein insertion porin family
VVSPRPVARLVVKCTMRGRGSLTRCGLLRHPLAQVMKSLLQPIWSGLLGLLLYSGLNLWLDPLALAGGETSIEIVPRYVIEAIDIRGNLKTKDYVIRRALGISAGERLSIEDQRFEIARFRVISLGFFSEVRLKLEKGSSRGRVILVVDVEERGTLLLTELFLGYSEATTAWGGLGLAENNFLGRGLSVEGAFVLGADPEVDRGDLQQSYRLRLRASQLSGTSLSLSTTFIFLDGSDFFRRSGTEDSSDPRDFLSIRYRRLGGALAMGFDLYRYTRLYLGYRVESIRSNVPDGAVRIDPAGRGQPINFGIVTGDSVLSVVTAGLERDTRSDPTFPTRGSLLTLSGEFSSGLVASSFDYAKFSASCDVFFPLRWGHVTSLQARGGVVFGQAPFFEKFFIGDYNDLLPARALGLNFSTLPSLDVFGTTIDAKRYEEIALRTAVEYIIPWFRGGRNIYGGDFFLNVGLIALTSRSAMHVRDRPLAESIPIDLTVDAGLRLDTSIGLFRLSIGNALGRIPF